MECVSFLKKTGHCVSQKKTQTHIHARFLPPTRSLTRPHARPLAFAFRSGEREGKRREGESSRLRRRGGPKVLFVALDRALQDGLRELVREDHLDRGYDVFDANGRGAG